jgi:hypothetical protein
MKKLTLLVAVLAMGLLFASCNKEGQFNPKKKIDRVCYSSTSKYEVYQDGYWSTSSSSSTDKYVSEIWNWDGKLLKGITYYSSDGELRYTENYEYDGKRLVSISWGNAGRFAFNYEKGKIASIDYFNGTVKGASYDFTHENGKITNIKVTNYDSKKGAAVPFPVNAMRFFIPSACTESFVELMAKIDERANTKEIETYDIKIEWDGKNVAKVTYIEGAYSESNEYAYDNKKNPYYGLFDIDEFGVTEILSQNNVTRRVYRDSDNDYKERDYVYTYEGNFPTMQTCSYTNNYDTYRYSYTNIYYYEYK